MASFRSTLAWLFGRTAISAKCLYGTLDVAGIIGSGVAVMVAVNELSALMLLPHHAVVPCAVMQVLLCWQLCSDVC